MCRVLKLFIIIPALLVMVQTTQAQAVSGVQDSVAVKETQGKDNETRTQMQADKENKNEINGEDNNNPSVQNDKKKGIKQVRSARPDMSKAKGARPPRVVRQSGSGVPKGMGRPGGARVGGRR